jgi:peroxiredoxin
MWMTDEYHEQLPGEMNMEIKQGSSAPTFALYDTNRKERSLAEFGGKNVVLAFYPGAFTGACTKEMCAFRDSLTQFNQLNAQIVGISVDAPFANKAFADQNKLEFPLLSDYTRAVSRSYGGVYEDFAGLKGYAASKRAVYVVNGNGVVTYAWVSENPGVEPNYEDIKKVIA